MKENTSFVKRCEYRACLKEQIDKQEWMKSVNEWKELLHKEQEEKKIMMAGLFQYKSNLFFYVEYVINQKKREEKKDDNQGFQGLPKHWKEPLKKYLLPWPGLEEKKHWALMMPVFWFDEPQTYSQWKRIKKPSRGCGRIAYLYPNKVSSYVSYHQRIVEEGLLVGDRFQMISLHENILFSYFEVPRDNEQVNIKKSKEDSLEILRWKEQDPPTHFYHFPQAKGEDFLVIETLFDLLM